MRRGLQGQGVATGQAMTVVAPESCPGCHAGLDLEGFDRIYLNGLVPNLRGSWAGGQFVRLVLVLSIMSLVSVVASGRKRSPR